MTDSPPEDITLDCDVAIVGAGLAGLVAATELQSRAPELRVRFQTLFLIYFQIFRY